MISFFDIKGIITPYGLMCVSSPEEREYITPRIYWVYYEGVLGLGLAFTVNTDMSPGELEERVISWSVERSFR